MEVLDEDDVLREEDAARLYTIYIYYIYYYIYLYIYYYSLYI